MEVGKTVSPIVEAIARAEEGTTGEVHVHLSHRWWEPKPLQRAWKIFWRYGLDKTRERTGVLLYVNLRRHKFAVIGDAGIHAKVGDKYWAGIASQLGEDLHGTHWELAVALAVRALGKVLREHFPASADKANQNELPNQVTQD